MPDAEPPTDSRRAAEHDPARPTPPVEDRGEADQQQTAGGASGGAAHTPVVLADADKLPLEARWHISIRVVESGSDDGSQYGHFVRISPRGEMFESLRHEVKGGAVWKEETTPRGRIEQLDAHTVRIEWRPEDPRELRIQARDKRSFVLSTHWTIKDDPQRRATMPYPRSPAGDRNVAETWTFERKSPPGMRP